MCWLKQIRPPPGFLAFLAFWTSFAGGKKSQLAREEQELIEQI